MSNTSPDDRLEVPVFWKVQAVFDPEGTGGDFAYTIGLAERGFSELHVYGWPSLGDDPGVDWMLSSRDRCLLLNELAILMVRGELGVGSTLRREYDGGLAVVELRVDPPGDRNELEALLAPPGAEVLPVRWSLSRAPEGPGLPLGEPALALARERYARLLGEVEPWTRLPPGWELPAVPSYEPGQRFGPLTPLVLARAASMTLADADTMIDFLCLASTVEHAHSLSWGLTRARALGRPAGRTSALDALQAGVEELCELWLRDGRCRRRWRRVVDFFVARPREPGRPVGRKRVERNVQRMLWTAVAACLAGEVVADVADEELRLHAAGPWQMTISPLGRPGGEWYAAEPVLDRVRALLRGLSVGDLLTVAQIHEDGMEEPDDGSEPGPYGELRTRLVGWTIVSAAGSRPVLEMVTDPTVAVFLAAGIGQARTDRERHCYQMLADWLDCCTCALVHRVRLRSADVDVFAAPYRRLLPGLRAMLDEPL